jgi:hypothetical protein
MATSKDEFDDLPSDSEPNQDNMMGDYCITVPDDSLTVSDVTDIGTLIDVGSTDYNIDWDAITITTDNNTYMEGDLIFQPEGEEEVHVLETIREQTLQIEALTDMIKEMVETKTFDIEWDLDIRVEQKRFLNKLKGGK